MNINDIVSGCNFQKIANHVIDSTSVNNKRDYKDNDIIFCKTDFVSVLFSQLRDSKNKYTLITHQSDYEINERIFNTKPQCINRWFAQNVNYKHTALIPIPIGIENHTGPSKGIYTDFDFFNSLDITKVPQKIHNKIYCNFSIKTHPHRNGILNSLVSNGVGVSASNKPYKEYWEEASKYLFIASPRGNGIDCHRTWEALLMGSIPIVEKHFMYDAYPHLPIMQVDDWSEFVDMNYPSPKGDGFPLSSNSFGVVQRLLRVVPTLVF